MVLATRKNNRSFFGRHPLSRTQVNNEMGRRKLLAGLLWRTIGAGNLGMAVRRRPPCGQRHSVRGRSYLSATFLGVEPAQYENEGVVTEPLARYAAAGLAVIQSLEGDLRSSAIVSSRPEETLVGAGKDGVIPSLEGSPTDAWTDCHRAKLAVHHFPLDRPAAGTGRSGETGRNQSRTGRALLCMEWPGGWKRGDILPHLGPLPDYRVLHPGKCGSRRRALSLGVQRPNQRIWKESCPDGFLAAVKQQDVER